MVFIVIFFLLLFLVLYKSTALLKYVLHGKCLKYSVRVLKILDSIALLYVLAMPFFMKTGFPPKGMGPLFHVLVVTLFFQIINTVVLGVWLLLRKIWRRVEDVPFDEGRRNTLKLGMAAPIAAMGISLYGNRYERCHTVINEYSIPVKGLDSRLDNYKIAQLSDVHLGPFFSLEDWKELLDMAAEGKPDVLVITGDLFDDREQNAEAAKILDSYCDKFPQGIYFCRGNHEYMRGMETIEGYIEKIHIHELVNESCELVQGTGLYIAGADYPMDRENFDKLRKEYVEEIFSGIPNDAKVILLSHHPDFIDDGYEHNTVLTLTGHTHGGQYAIAGVPIFHNYKYMRGIYKNGDSTGYVHSGNGSWMPMRLGCPPEIATFILKKA